MKRNLNVYPVILFGIMPSNYSPMHWPLYQDDFSLSQSWRKKKCRSLLKNTYNEEPSMNPGVHMRLISSLSKRRMESYDQYKIIIQLTNGLRRTETSPPLFPRPSTASADVPCLPSLTSVGDTTMFKLNMEMSGKPPSSPQRGFLSPPSCSSVSLTHRPPSK